ncbi:hypothetical protein [Microbacterium sp. CH12i]|uniref:hypothetical protein n=1 Tax=Microbacterium sp. CH12i TaxID=1479651 RepID=UPI001F2C3321|nr:hypothetical protein [Microbacterium sp. CH12i]
MYAELDAVRVRNEEVSRVELAETLDGEFARDRLERAEHRRPVLAVAEPELVIVARELVILEREVVRVQLLPAFSAGRNGQLRWLQE